MRSMTKEDIIDLIHEVWGKDAPYGVAISSCEGGLMQFEKDGRILRGRVNPRDIGIFQINSDHHEDTYLKLNIDVFTPRGNIEYAKFIFDQNGTQPWYLSEFCWKKKLVRET